MSKHLADEMIENPKLFKETLDLFDDYLGWEIDRVQFRDFLNRKCEEHCKLGTPIDFNYFYSTSYRGVKTRLLNALSRAGYFTDEDLVRGYNADAGVNWYCELYSRKPFNLDECGEQSIFFIGAYMIIRGLADRDEYIMRYHRKYSMSAINMGKRIDAVIELMEYYHR